MHRSACGTRGSFYTPEGAIVPVSGRSVEDVLVVRGLATLLYVVVSPLSSTTVNCVLVDCASPPNTTSHIIQLLCNPQPHPILKRLASGRTALQFPFAFNQEIGQLSPSTTCPTTWSLMPYPDSTSFTSSTQVHKILGWTILIPSPASFRGKSNTNFGNKFSYNSQYNASSMNQRELSFPLHTFQTSRKD
jgi:hypothetical protein